MAINTIIQYLNEANSDTEDVKEAIESNFKHRLDQMINDLDYVQRLMNVPVLRKCLKSRYEKEFATLAYLGVEF